MIKKIKISDDDEKNALTCVYLRDNNLVSMDFSGVVVNKPWGYEYLMFKNHEISIWLLYIKKGYATSTHCHPNKKTSLLLISGDAVSSTLLETFSLKEKDGLIFDKGVFHRTEALSENGAFIMEIETPSDKTDLLRLKDNYKREAKAYTAKHNITNKTYNYHFQFIEDKDGEVKTLGKYKFFLKEYFKKEDLIENLGKIVPDAGILVCGEMKMSEESIGPGDLIEIEKLSNSQFSSPIKILFLHERKNLVKLSDFVISFLQKKGLDNVFLISGGNLMHLLESIRVKGMTYYCAHHEQASSMAADAHARVSNKIGFLMVTSGPGGTNAITGVTGAWIDSIPILVISGQSYENQTIKNTGLRQLGVQEINIIDIVKPITKYAEIVRDAKKIKYCLEKALYIAQTGKPGPVWIDIPVNIQLAMIGEEELESFEPPKNDKIIDSELKEKVSKIIYMIKNSKRPVILLGNGVRLAKAEKEFFEMAEKLLIPILTTRNANDIIYEEHPLYAGRPGSFGQRYANFTIQNSDLLLSIGSRIGLAVTGWAYRDFAREAKKIIVDIDSAELKKPTIFPDLTVNSDAGDFIREMLKQLEFYESLDIREWKDKIRYWKEKYPVALPEYAGAKGSVNTYYFIDLLSEELKEDDIIVTDMGMSFQCTMQGMKLKKGQRLFTQSGLASMGYGLPAAIGACIANKKKRIICITGDGGLQMNVQEFQTVKHYNLPIKVFVFNNKGYTSQRETQRAYFAGYVGSDPSSGVSTPDFSKVAKAYGLKSKKIDNQDNLRQDIREALDYDGAFVCDLDIDELQQVNPKQGAFNRPDGKTVPRPIEDMIPYTTREELEKDMVIRPIPFDPYRGEEK